MEELKFPVEFLFWGLFFEWMGGRKYELELIEIPKSIQEKSARQQVNSRSSPVPVQTI
jgi:hypothetical protein